jgi:hypothetical protein
MNMNTRKNKFSIIGALAFGLLSVSLAHAQSNRTWVSPSGDDANNCTVNKPCKTFAGALAKTNSGGEIVVQESGGFGPVTINKAITINGAGKYAGIQQSSANAPAITVNVNAVVVVLRGLTLNGLSTAPVGIEVSNVGELHVEDCTISAFTTYGIDAFFNGRFLIKDTTIGKISSETSGTAIHIAGKSLIDHCRVAGNDTGIEVGPGKVTISDSVVSDNVQTGIYVVNGTATIERSVVSGNANGIYLHSNVVNSPTVTSVEGCVVTGNGNGLLISGIISPNGTNPRIFYVSNTMISDNDFGIHEPIVQPDIQFISFGNNRLANNNTDGSFTSTKQPQ